MIVNWNTHRLGRPTHRLLNDLLGPLSLHRFGHDSEPGVDGEDADDVLAQIREQAGGLHDRIVHDQRVTYVEFLGATGGGKTTLIERLIEQQPDGETVGVIAGDVAGHDDADRFRELGIEAVDVATGKECHLDPGLVGEAADELDLADLDCLYVENVGNMVCPADFPLGASTRVLVVSATEGDDVVRKHPLLFQACDAAVLNKIDLADAVGADINRMGADVDRVAPGMAVFETNARTGQGVDALAEFLRGHDHSGNGGHTHHPGHLPERNG